MKYNIMQTILPFCLWLIIYVNQVRFVYFDLKYLMNFITKTMFNIIEYAKWYFSKLYLF